MDSVELIKALEVVSKEKGIDSEVIFEAVENSLVTACKKIYGNYSNMRVEINRETGEMRAFAQREVVEEVVDDFIEISLEEARELNPTYELGDFVDNDITPNDFGRSAAQSAKQIEVQKLKEKKSTMNLLLRKEIATLLLLKELMAEVMLLLNLAKWMQYYSRQSKFLVKLTMLMIELRFIS